MRRLPVFVLLCASLACRAADPSANDAIIVTPGTGGLTGDLEAASQGAVEDDRLESRPLLRPSEVLEAIPGVVITQHSGAGKANQYFLRGFNLDHGTDFSVNVDGMPVNLPSHGHGQGYADLNFLIPELVDRIDYRKGPYSADEGDFSAAGSARIHYKRMLVRDFADFSLGSFGYRRGLFATGGAIGGGRLMGALEVVGDNGPWDSPEKLRKLNGLLRYAAGTQADGFSITAMSYSNRWNATDQIPQRAVDAGTLGRFGTIDPTDGGRSSRNSLSASWARTEGSNSTRASAYVIRSRLDLFSNFTYFLNRPATGDQFEQVDRRIVSGGDVAHTWQTRLAGLDTENTVGMRLRNDNIGEVGLFNTVGRQRIATVRSDAVVQSSVGLYFINAIRWNEWLRTTAGMRGDAYRFKVNSDNIANSGTVRDAIVSPKFGLILGPWADTEYFFNWGYGFHSNDARGATITVDPGTGAPAARVTPLVRARGTEIGLRSAPFRGFQTSVALWRLEVDSELLFVGDAGTTTPGRPSQRSGIEWSNQLKPIRSVTVDLDANWSRARFQDSAATGNFIPGAPDRTTSAGLTYASGPWNAGLRLRYFGARPLVADNSQRSRPSALLSAKISYVVSQQLRLGLEVHNLLNRVTNDIDYYYASRLSGEAAAGANDLHSHPAEPRSLRLSAMLYF